MTSIRSRLLSGSLALLLALGAPSAAWAADASAPETAGDAADLLAITVPDYTPGPGLQAGDVSQVKQGELYTLIILPAQTAAEGGVPKELTPDLLLGSDPLFVGSAVASADGKVTFTGIRLRTAEAAVYYVTGPGLEPPLAEATGLSVSAEGRVLRKVGSTEFSVDGAAVSLVDKTTRYAYRNSVATANGGSFKFDHLSPGEYFLHVEKPGYLPATSSTHFDLTDDEEYYLPSYDVSSYIGDVNNDGRRDLTDLTDLLSHYGRSLPADAGLTPDLNEDNAVNIADVALYLTAASAAQELTLGTGTPADAANASLTFRDAALSGPTDRTLVLSLDHGGYTPLTFTAANVSLTFRSDYIQPINQNGGAVAPGSAAASCLIPKAGVTLSQTRWDLKGDLATLTFSLSCAKPAALTDLVELRYRPAPGKTTDDFFQGVFTLDHIAAQVGGATVLTDCALEYPNSAPLSLTSISIDLEETEITVPAAGHTVVLALTATGHKDGVAYPALSGVTWTLSDNASGVSIADSLLTITPEAAAGTVTLTASRDGVTSAPVSITLVNAPAVPARLDLTRAGDPVETDALSAPAGDPFSVSYAARVIDQYGEPIDGTVSWSLSGAPAGVSVSADGVLTAAANLPAGTYTFSLLASLDGLRAAVDITLTLEAALDRLVLSGPASAQIPTGAGTVTLSYLLSAIDAQGYVIPSPALDLSFAVLPREGEGQTAAGINPDADMSGNLTVTVDSSAQPGDYTLRVTADGITADFILTLHPFGEESASTPVRAALSYQGALTGELDLTFTQGAFPSDPLPVRHLLLDQNGSAITPQSQSWAWTTDPVSLPTGTDGQSAFTWTTPAANSNTISFVVNSTLSPGSYFFTLTAADSVSRLSVSVPVRLTVLSQLASLSLSAPDSLTVPTGNTLRYPLGITALNADGEAISLPDGLCWSVTDSKGAAPDGVTLQNGVLNVTASAKPGPLTLSVWLPGADGAKDHLVTKTLTLTPADSEKVLALRRDGRLLSGGVDATYCKEGADLSLVYTPVLLDRATGAVTELTEGFTWLGTQGSFSLDQHTEPGTYTAPITVLYDGRSVSVTAQITVYPQITNLYIDFDEGDADPIANRYSFPVPSQVSKTYHGTLMAQITRGSAPKYIPLAQLGLAEYDIDVYTPLTGIYLAYDKATGRLALTVEPTAGSNSMKNPSSSEPEIRYLGIELSYYPGEDPIDLRQSLLLTKESLAVSNAVLRQGKGAGSKFIFETARGETSLQTSPGVLSDCFALELLDQYGNPVTNQPVTWSPLTGSPKKDGADLITLLDPGDAVKASYPRYQSLRRLRVSPDTPAGTYSLTLTASAAGFSRSIQISMEVSDPQPLETIDLTGPNMAVIPKWYAQYNSSATNSEQRTLSYVAVAQDAHGNELDATLCDFTWSVTDDAGKSVSGVAARPNTDNTATATVIVDRDAKPTTTLTADNEQVKKPLHVTVTVTPKTGGDPCSAEVLLTLNRGNLVPTLMTIQGKTSYKIELDGPNVTENYTFTLVNQYNEPVSDRDAQTVEWSLNSSHPSYVSLSKSKDSKGYPVANLTIRNPKTDTRTTVTLTAAITFPEASTASGKATVYRSLSIPITIGNPPIGGGLPPEEVPITVTTVTPSTNKSGTTGTVTLSTEDIDALSKTVAEGTLTIAPKSTGGLTSVTVTLPGSMLKAIREKTQNQSLRLQTAIGTVTIPKQTLSEFSSNGNSTVTIRSQDNTLEVTFRSGSSDLKTFSSGRAATFSAPVKGDIVTAVKGGVSTDVLKKTVISNGTLTVTLTGSAELTVGTKPTVKVFSDTYNHWAKEAVEFVTARNLFQGTSETTFSPDGDMTRSMVVTVLHRLENTPASNASNLFRDVPSGTWYTDAVAWASSRGIVQGTGDGFLPNDSVTREQLATILYRYMKELGHSISDRSPLSSFSDQANVSSWAQEAMEWAVGAGIITGKTGGLLDPGGKATRAEVATMLERLIRAISPSA